MEKKVFSVKYGNMVITDSNLYLYEKKSDGYILQATTNIEIVNKVHLLPYTLIRKQKSGEELAKIEYLIEDENTIYERKAFLAGRKSFGYKEFHLTREELEKIIGLARVIDNNGIAVNKCDYLISSLTHPIYPHTIEVMHDGNNYLWETLNAIY